MAHKMNPYFKLAVSSLEINENKLILTDTASLRDLVEESMKIQ